MTASGPDDPRQTFDWISERIKRGLAEPASRDEPEASVDDNGGPPHPPDMDGNWRSSVDSRLSRLEGSVEGLRTSLNGVRWFVGLLAVIMIGGFSFLGFQLSWLEGRVDRIETAVAAIPQHLNEEFRAMRADMAAQTSAIANSITATRQAQPPPPQIIVVPTPQPKP